MMLTSPASPDLPDRWQIQTPSHAAKECQLRHDLFFNAILVYPPSRCYAVGIQATTA